MAKKEEKSKAEIYREERKARIAKANKKNAKGSGSGLAGKVLKRIIAVVLAVAIVGGAAYYVIDNTGFKNKMITSVEVGDEKVNSATFYYYYYLAYQQALQTQENYNSYGWTYIDSQKSPDEQDSPYTDDDGNAIKWDEELRIMASTRAQSTLANYNEALKANIQLTDDEKSEIEETINSFKTNAESSGYSVNAYLKATFGFGLKELQKQMEIEQLAAKFQESKQEELENSIKDEDLNKELKENANSYGVASLRYYAFKFETLTKNDGETDEAFEARQKNANADITKKAKEAYKSVTDAASLEEAIKAYEKTLKKDDAEKAEDTAEKAEEKEELATVLKNATYSSASSAIEEDGAKWAFDAARKAGDKKLVEGKNGTYIVIVDAPKSIDSHSVTVRYCLIPYNDDFTSAANEDEKTEAKDTATKLYDDWKKSGKTTEDTFATLCKENSKDSSTSEDGGKIDVRLNQMVKSFEEWCFDSSRKVGDTGLVEAEEYGYFIIYFVSDNKDDLDWKDSAKNTLSEKAYETFSEELLSDEGSYKVTDHEKAEKAIVKDFCKKMKRNIALSNRAQ